MTFQNHPPITARFRAAYRCLMSKLVMDSQPWWEVPVREYQMQRMIDGL